MKLIQQYFGLQRKCVRSIHIACRERCARFLDELADLRSSLDLLIRELSRDAVQALLRRFD